MSQAHHPHSAILRRAVMRAQPAFYSWSEDEQLAYRMSMPDEACFILERSVFYDLYGVDCKTEEALREAWNDVPIDELDAINETLLPWKGIGEDCFYLNEFVADEDRLRFATVDEYVRNDHAFQESARQESDSKHVIKPYRGNLQGTWARLYVDGRLRYATLTSLAGHLFDHVSSVGHDLLESLIPHRYVRGPNDGKREGSGFVWDMRRDADGLEPQLDELSTRLYRYEAERWFELLEEFDRQAKCCVYVKDVRFETGEEQTRFIFSDKTAMVKTRFQCFLRNIRRLEHDASELAPLEQRETDLLSEFLNAQYEDIQQNFNPKIAKLKKRRKILVHKDAFR